jgi:methylated-DNA-protein-cysteine methyltransferase-like protein
MINLPDPTPYYRLVWEIVKQVPPGKVTTFGQIASMIPPPDGIEMEDYAKVGARWVGDAMNRISTIDDPAVPWHRVINAKGMISLPELSRAAAVQRGRLRDEGTLGEDAEGVDLDEYGWEGPDMDFLDEHDLLMPKPLTKKKRLPPPKNKPLPVASPPVEAAAPPAAAIPPWESQAAFAEDEDEEDDTPQQLRLF